MAVSADSINLDGYWINVATPYFLSILGFSMFVLFNLKGAVLGGPKQVATAVRNSRNIAGVRPSST
jgi:hypothetical protein